jgi:hypothetical protein
LRWSLAVRGKAGGLIRAALCEIGPQPYPAQPEPVVFVEEKTIECVAACVAS